MNELQRFELNEIAAQSERRDAVICWIDKDKDGYALAALLIQSRLALVVAVSIGMMLASWLAGPPLATIATIITFSVLKALRPKKRD